MKPMKPTNPTRPTRSTIPCYAADGTPLGYRPLDAAQRLVAGGYVRPAYGRKGHLRAIWLLRDDGTSPVQPRAHNGATSNRWLPGGAGVCGGGAGGAPPRRQGPPRP